MGKLRSVTSKEKGENLMLKTLLAQVKEFKKASFLTPVFMILESTVYKGLHRVGI